jgi:hypothetical protein
MPTPSQPEILLERAVRFDSYIRRNPRGGRDFCPSSLEELTPKVDMIAYER